jgi:hypothetical protein
MSFIKRKISMTDAAAMKINAAVIMTLMNV